MPSGWFYEWRPIVKAVPACNQGKRIKIRFGTSFRSANGAAHTSLGQRPRFERKEDPGLKARAISTHNCQIGAGLQP